MALHKTIRQSIIIKIAKGRHNHLQNYQAVQTNYVKVTIHQTRTAMFKFVCKLYVAAVKNSFKKTLIAFIVNKFTLIKLMMEKSGLCVNNALDGCIPHVRILIRNKIPTHYFSV